MWDMSNFLFGAIDKLKHLMTFEIPAYLGYLHSYAESAKVLLLVYYVHTDL